MKIWCVILALGLMLCGCGAEETYETVSDELLLSVMASPREISLTLPEEALLPAMETDSGTLYMCSGYDVSVQTLESGDLEKTIRSVSGYGPDDLMVIETAAGAYSSYEFVWTASGELGEQVCRCQILDDGNYHYVLTAMADADVISEYQEIWNGMFESFGLI